MNAVLTAWGTLLMADLMSESEYLEKLHDLYLEHPDSELLYRLELSTANQKDTLALLLGALDTDDPAQTEAFARLVFAPIEQARRDDLPLAELVGIAMRIWRALPRELADRDPFAQLSCADDELYSIFDPAAARDAIDRALSYYDVPPAPDAEPPRSLRAGMRAYWRNDLKRRFIGMSVAFWILTLLCAVVVAGQPERSYSFAEWFMEQKSDVFASATDLQLSAGAVFLNNLQACALGVVLGFVPFLHIPELTMALNAAIIGIVCGGMQSLPLAVAALLPHGIFEIPAVLLAWTLGSALCRQVGRKIRRKPDAHVGRALKQTLLFFLIVIAPLLLAAALVEANLTERILWWVAGRCAG